MILKTNESKIVLAGFLAITAVLLVMGFLAVREADRSAGIYDQVNQLRKHSVEIGKILAGMTDAETGTRGFLVTGEEVFLDPYQPGLAQTQNSLRKLNSRLDHLPGQHERLVQLEALVSKKIREMEALQTSRQRPDYRPDTPSLLNTKGTMDQIRAVLAGMLAAENQAMSQYLGAAAAKTTGTRRLLAGSVALAVIVFGLATFRRLQDIRTRNTAGRALRQSEERFNLAVAGSNDGIWDWNVLTNEVFYAPRFWELLDYPADQFPPNQFDSWRRVVHPEDLEPTMRAVTAHFENREDYDVEYRMKTWTGEWRSFRAKGQALWGEDGKPHRMAGSVSDITKSRAATRKLEAALREMRDFQSLNKSILDSMSEGIHGVDLAGNIIFENAAAYRMLGFEETDLIGKSGHQMIHHTRADGSVFPVEECPIYATFYDGEPREVNDEVFWRKDGSSFPVEYTTAPLWNDAGEIIGSAVSFRNITERLRREATMLRLTQALDATRDGVFLFDSESLRFIYVNHGAENQVGYSCGELLEMTPLDIKPDYCEESFRSLIAPLISGQEGAIQFNTVHRHKSGRLIPVDVILQLIRNDGKPAFFLNVVRDATEQRAFEEDLLAAKREAEHAGLAIARREAGIRRLYEATSTTTSFEEAVNNTLRTGCELFGMETGLLVVAEDGRLVVEHSHGTTKPDLEPGSAIEFEKSLSAVIIERESPVCVERTSGSEWADHPACRRFQIGAFCGAPVHTRSRIHGALLFTSREPRSEPFTEADSDLLGLLGRWIGGSLEYYREQDKLETAVDESNRANRAKSEFLSRMSHELRTPLNGILGFAQLMEMADLPERQKLNTQRILKAGRHLLELINEVLDLARVESGGLGISLEPVNVSETVREVADLLQPQATKRDITIEPFPTDSGLLVMADNHRLKQVLINLGANGIKYNRAGGRLFFAWERSKGSVVRITVRDTGPGIARADHEKIFTPFERLRAAETDVEGTGLGLALTQRLVTAMHGKIGVESGKGKGSTFWFELTEASSQMPKVKSDSRHLRRDDIEVDRPTLRVLYIEDNLENVQLMEEVLLLRPNVELLPAMQASIGLQLARDRRPDVIFLDLHLPDQNGDQVLEQLKADNRTKDLPVIMLTADAMLAQEERLLKLGAKEYVTKPIEVRKILEILDTLKPVKRKES